MASFLLARRYFYLVHNVSGAPRGDLPTGDVVLVAASLPGYPIAIAAVHILGSP